MRSIAAQGIQVFFSFV